MRNSRRCFCINHCSVHAKSKLYHDLILATRGGTFIKLCEGIFGRLILVIVKVILGGKTHKVGDGGFCGANIAVLKSVGVIKVHGGSVLVLFKTESLEIA